MKEEHLCTYSAKKAIHPLAWIVCTFAILLCLAGCSSESTVTSASDQKVQTKEVPLIFEASEEPETVSLTFFSDMPSVPHIRIDDFYRTFMHGELDVALEGDVFTLTEADGTKATVDVYSGTFTSDDFGAFVTQPLLKGDGASTLATSLAPFLALESETVEEAAHRVTIDFARYGIDLRAMDGSLYLPLATANDLFETSKSFRAFWDGSTVYAAVLDSTDTHRRTEPVIDDEAYVVALGQSEVRSPDMAEFAYRNMCFKIDNFYGLPGTAPLNDEVATDGLDKALIEHDPTTRELLHSLDPKEYLWGLNRLLGHDLDDKMHTAFSDFDTLNMMFDDPFAASVLELEDLYGTETNPDKAAFIASLKGVRAAKDQAFGEGTSIGNFYTEHGDTALFSFQTFTTDAQGWTDYYAGKSDMPTETDSYAALIDAIRKAEANPEVKNLVIDLTTNSGGEADAVAGICSIITGDCAFHSMDTLTGQRTTVELKADRNIDGTIDEADDAVSFDLNFAVLTCASSYSSANLLPQLLHERGIAVLGERSGGGACAMEFCATADGWQFTISSNTKVMSDTWESIDDGVPVDVELVEVGSDGKRDYSALYDLVVVDQAMRSFYHK